MTFREYVAKREFEEGTVKPINYKPGALVPSIVRPGGPEAMSPFKAQNPSRPTKPKPYMPIFRAGKSPKQAPSTVVNH